MDIAKYKDAISDYLRTYAKERYGNDPSGDFYNTVSFSFLKKNHIIAFEKKEACTP